MNDTLDNTINVPEHVVIPEAQDQITLRFQRRGSLHVLFNRLAVLPAIQFDDQARGLTTEVYDVAIDRHLPPKLQIA